MTEGGNPLEETPMKLSVPLMLFAALVLAGCSRPVVRETVIERPTIVEKPVVVEKQVIVERPVAERPVVATTPPASCSYSATTFNHGSYSCQMGNQYRCTNGGWDSTGLRC